jgi:hypothetical protein
VALLGEQVVDDATASVKAGKTKQLTIETLLQRAETGRMRPLIMEHADMLCAKIKAYGWDATSVIKIALLSGGRLVVVKGSHRVEALRLMPVTDNKALPPDKKQKRPTHVPVDVAEAGTHPSYFKLVRCSPAFKRSGRTDYRLHLSIL